MTLLSPLVINGDIVLSAATGRFTMLSGTPKLTQALRRNLNTIQQPDGTGAGFDDLIGQPSDPFEMRNEISTRLADSVAAMKKAQQIQLGQRDPAEILSKVTNLTVFPATTDASGNIIDKTTYVYRVDVESAVRNQTVSITGAIVG